MERTLRRILGIDLKMKQYAQGSRFVKAVVEEAGMATFNKVWTSPQTLPTKDEFVHPRSCGSTGWAAEARWPRAADGPWARTPR